MNQRHIHDDGYSFQDPLINNLNNKKVFESKKQNFSNEDSQHDIIIIITTTSRMKVILLDVSVILVLKIMI